MPNFNIDLLTELLQWITLQDLSVDLSQEEGGSLTTRIDLKRLIIHQTDLEGLVVDEGELVVEGVVFSKDPLVMLDGVQLRVPHCRLRLAEELWSRLTPLAGDAVEAVRGVIDQIQIDGLKISFQCVDDTLGVHMWLDKLGCYYRDEVCVVTENVEAEIERINFKEKMPLKLLDGVVFKLHCMTIHFAPNLWATLVPLAGEWIGFVEGLLDRLQVDKLLIRLVERRQRLSILVDIEHVDISYQEEERVAIEKSQFALEGLNPAKLHTPLELADGLVFWMHRFSCRLGPQLWPNLVLLSGEPQVGLLGNFVDRLTLSELAVGLAYMKSALEVSISLQRQVIHHEDLDAVVIESVKLYLSNLISGKSLPDVVATSKVVIDDLVVQVAEAFLNKGIDIFNQQFSNGRKIHLSLADERCKVEVTAKLGTSFSVLIDLLFKPADRKFQVIWDGFRVRKFLSLPRFARKLILTVINWFQTVSPDLLVLQGNSVFIEPWSIAPLEVDTVIKRFAVEDASVVIGLGQDESRSLPERWALLRLPAPLSLEHKESATPIKLKKVARTELIKMDRRESTKKVLATPIETEKEPRRHLKRESPQ